MTFQDYLAKLDAPPKDAARRDRQARRDGIPRDPLGTQKQRLSASRLVGQAERQLKVVLDFKKDAWPSVVATLATYGMSDWSSLRKSEQLAPPKPPSRRSRATQ